MLNRHPFRLHAIAVVLAAAVLSACASNLQEPPRPTVPQRAPGATQTLAPDGAMMASRDPWASNASTLPAPTRIVKVGLLLPTTGRNAALGRALLDAAQISLFDKYARLSPNQQSTRVELLPCDTGDNADTARAAMRSALDQGAEFIIGPVFSEAVDAAAPLAAARHVSMLSLSNNQARANNGVYVFGFSPEEQTQRIVRFAIERGKTRIAVLAPKSALGDTVVATARETMQSAGLTLVAEARYTTQGNGIDMALKSLVPTEGNPNFDALLMPEGGPALSTMLRAMQTRGVSPTDIQFLGTGIWDDAALLHRVNLDHAWFASSPPPSTAQFKERFSSVYHYVPPRIASLGYDAVALAVTLATSGRGFDSATLTSDGGFSGPANGIFRLRTNGQVQRGLAVIEVTGGGLRVISPPQEGFR